MRRLRGRLVVGVVGALLLPQAPSTATCMRWRRGQQRGIFAFASICAVGVALPFDPCCWRVLAMACRRVIARKSQAKGTKVHEQRRPIRAATALHERPYRSRATAR